MRGSSPGPVDRLVRSFSGPNITESPSTDAPTPGAKPEPVAGNTSSTAVHPKLSAVNRVKLFFKSKSKGPKIPFPPPSWFEDGNVVNPGASGAAAVPLPPKGGDDHKDSPGNDEHDGGTDDGTPPAPSWIAGKIQAMIDSLPPLPNSGPGSSDSPPSGDTSAGDQVKPLDPKLLKYISNASVMNGSISKGRQSVWSALEKLHSPWRLTVETVEDSPNAGNDGEDGEDDPTLMMYAPLVPDANSKVEIARSHTALVPVHGLEAMEAKIEEATVEAIKWPWPFTGWKGKPKQDNGGTTVPPANDGGKSTVPPNSSPGQDKTAKKVKAVRVWEPSATKLSVQAMWWGYRLYLPPPVMLVLNQESLAVAQKAALITTALKWLVDHIPVSILPLQLRPVVLLLQKLIPFIGYIGAFIAWSWGAIKAFDKGYGVTLTATWILPVGLLPATWQEKDFPKPQPPVVAPAPPVPAPGTGPPTGTPSGSPPVGPTPTPATPPATLPTPPSEPTPPVTALTIPDNAQGPKSKERVKGKKGKRS